MGGRMGVPPEAALGTASGGQGPSAGALWVAGTVATATDRIEFVDGQVLQRTGPHLFRCQRETTRNGPTLVCGGVPSYLGSAPIGRWRLPNEAG
jgi:hypothetical protein